jgi:citrate lyase beta subunit
MISENSLNTGVFLYTPANLTNISAKMSKIIGLDSLCLDFEDGFDERNFVETESQIVDVLTGIKESNINNINIFIRVKNPVQFRRISASIPPDLLDGFVFPKVTTGNFLRYFEIFAKYYESKLGFMPILETDEIANSYTRHAELSSLYQQLMEVKEHVIGLQLGAADFCRIFGLRRPLGLTIYDIVVLNSIISDILSVFLHDFAITGAVFEYFSGDFEETLRRETLLDRINGFSGKLAIHPAQVPVIKEAFLPHDVELEEAKQLVEMKAAVEKSASGRMNERNTHLAWAEKTLALSKALRK